MQKSATGMRTINRGFTLVEILIVLLIIGIVLTFAILAVGDFGQARRIKATTQKLEKLISLAEEQAMLEPATLGLALQNNGYRFYRYQIKTDEKPERWMLIEKDALFRSEKFPKGMQVSLTIDNKEQALNNSQNQPQIIIAPTGNITSFTLLVSINDKPPSLRLEGKANGLLQLTNLNDNA